MVMIHGKNLKNPASRSPGSLYSVSGEAVMGWIGRVPGALRATVCLLATGSLLLGFADIDGITLAKQESEDAGSAIRAVHGVANAGPLDVYVDGAIALIGVSFGDVSGDLALAPGDHEFEVVPSGSAPEASIADGQISLDEGTRHYAVLLGTMDEASVGLYAIDERPVDAGRARFRIISGVPDAGEIIPAFAGGEALSEPLGFGDASQYAAIDAGDYDLELLDAATGGLLLALPQSPFAEGDVTDVILIGQVSDGTMQALVLPTMLGVAPIGGRTAHIILGTCAAVGPPVADLGAVQVGEGATVGVPSAPAVAQGFGLAPLSFASLTDTPHALIVTDTGDLGAVGPIACGDIGGPLTDTGALVISLQPGHTEGPDGIAVLAPSLENPEATGVSIFLQRDVAEEEVSDAEPVSEEVAG
jgi:hypothetical protein